MSNIRFNALTTTATSAASDDYFAMDGTTNGTRKILANSFALLSGATFTGKITSTLGTLTSSTPALDSTQTWNSGGVTFTALKLNITDTASASASLLADLQVGGVSQFSVTKGGALATTGAISDNLGNVRSVPQNAQTASYTLAASDSGKHISITTGGVIVPSGIFSAGQVVTIYNNSSSSQTITQGSSVTLRQGGTTSTGNRTLASYGVATLLCVASNTFVISGAGLT